MQTVILNAVERASSVWNDNQTRILSHESNLYLT